MKRLFSLLLWVLVASSAFAQNWYPWTNHDYPDDNVYYVNVMINGVPASSNDGLELAAFINGQCRAAAIAPTQKDSASSYVLRVAGDLDQENNATISFKCRYQSLTYNLKVQDSQISKAVFTDVTTTTPGKPIVLYLDAITDVAITENPIEVSIPGNKLPYRVDASNYWKLVYGDGYTPKNLSSVAEDLSASWTFLDLAAGAFTPNVQYDAQTDEFVFVNAVEKTYRARLSVQADSAYFGKNANLEVKLIPTTIPVTDLSCDLDTVKVHTRENIVTLLNGHVHIQPNDATNQDFTLQVIEGDSTAFNGYWFTRGGYYEVAIKSADPNYSGYAVIHLFVQQYVDGIELSGNSNEATIEIGENVEDAVRSLVRVITYSNSAAYLDDELSIDYMTGAILMDMQHVAIAAGDVEADVYVKNGVIDPASGMVMPSPHVQVTIHIKSEDAGELSLKAKVLNTRYSKHVASDESPVLVSVDGNTSLFDANLLTITFSDRYAGYPYAVQTGVQQIIDMAGQSGYGFSIDPKFVGKQISYTVSYNGNPIQVDGDPTAAAMAAPSITIEGAEQLAEGWNWMAVNSSANTVGSMAVESVFADINAIQQIRSQEKMVFNDDTYGLFGDLESIVASEATYKIYANSATQATFGSYNIFQTSEATSPVEMGYNWINNPYEFDVVPSQFNQFLGFTPLDGDKLITQDDFAEYSNGSWMCGNSFVLSQGKGLVYYYNGESRRTITFNSSLAPVSASQPSNKIKARADYFQYNSRAYADNMTMVVRIEGLAHAEDYELGVFVGDECRGMGHAVAGNLMFVNICGERGSNLSFKLYNKQNGDIVDIDETLRAKLVSGSVASPVILHAPEVTGISQLDAAKAASQSVYDLSGRRVEKVQKGIYIKDGKKVLK